MHKRTISEIEEEYDLELDKIEREIEKIKAKRVLLQFPDGLKLYATTIVDYLEEKCKNTEFFIWLGTCFGACDVPNIPGNMRIDLLIQFGHTKLKINF